MASVKNENPHTSVLLRECVEWLEPKAGRIFVDATLGMGGHTRALLEASPETRVIGVDQDADAIRIAARNLESFGDRVSIVKANFSTIAAVVRDAGLKGVDGVLADLGVSSLQFDTAERGFSFRFDAPLDMRMNRDDDIETAAELLARLSEEEIADIIYRFGEERASRRIARRIVWKRKIGEPVTTTLELAETVEKAIGRQGRDKIHPATRTFQALRIAVNGEIEILERFVRDAVGVLNPGGRLAVITFHSLEDRVVKQTFLKMAGRCSCPPRLPQCVCGAAREIEILTRRPVVPDAAEMSGNPRSRSAKLRVCEKIDKE